VLHVFAQGDDRNIWHNVWTSGNGWSGWSDDIGAGTFTSAPAAVTHGPDVLHVFAQGDDRNIWHNVWPGGDA
jgi:hypothetical protein